METEGVGVERCLGCTCVEGVVGPCAFHSACRQAVRLRDMGLTGGTFFPTTSGGVASKQAVVKSIIDVLQALKAEPCLLTFFKH